MSIESIRYKNILSFILSERLLTITVLGSIFTFQFISAFKLFLIDPLLDFVIPSESFSFLNVTLRDGVLMTSQEPKLLSLDFGNFFKAFITYIFLISILFLLAKYTRFPDEALGNIGGNAIM
jgi:large-conductance mechanosensitive channel